MKRGKDEEKTMGPMFPRLHVNDTEKGGPRAPPRNKMALYEQLSIPSQRFNGGVLPFNPNSTANSLPPSSSTQGTANERGTFSPLQQSSSMHPTRKRDTHHSDISNHRMQQEQKNRQEEDDFRVPIFDQQSGTSQNRSGNHQNRENEGITPFGAAFSGRLANVQNARQSNKFQKENSQEFARSASNQSSRQNNKVPLKETNESSSFSHRNGSHNSGRLRNNGNLRDYRLDSQADNTLWGDSVVNETSKAIGYGNSSVPVREVQQEAVRSPSDPTNADTVSETSMVDSICGVDISPDDVVGVIGQKHFWKARRAIVNQQRVFAVQVFELHRLIKVQRLIAGSPHLLVEDNAYMAKQPKVSPIKKIPLEYVLKSTLKVPKHKSEAEKPNEDTEFSAENAVGKASPSSVQNGRPFTGNPLPPSDPNLGSWNYNPPPGHQWLIPVMSPSEGLVYKPYPGPGFMNPMYGGCGPPGSMPMIGQSFANYGVPPSDHHYEGPSGGHPFPPASHGYFPSYGMPMASPLVSSSRCEQTNPFNLHHHHQSSSNVPVEKNGAAVPNVVKFHASKDSEVQASTASSRSDRTRGRNALPLFPTSPPPPAPVPAPAPARFEAAEPPRVIRVVPHNARSAIKLSWIVEMSGRNRMPRGHRDGPMPVVHRGPGPLPPHPAALEEELELQHRDIQRIVAENGHVVEENVILQRELSAVKDEIHRLAQIIPKLHADRDARARDLIDRGMKLEAELRETEPLRADVGQLRAEAQKLNSLRQELSNQVQNLTKDTSRLKAENEQGVAIKADIDGMHKDLAEMRRDYEMMKKANEEHLIQKEAMEKNLISMAREIEKLRGEQMRARGLGGGGYGTLSGSPDMRYPGGGYGDVYGGGGGSGGGWGSYDHRGPARH